MTCDCNFSACLLIRSGASSGGINFVPKDRTLFTCFPDLPGQAFPSFVLAEIVRAPPTPVQGFQPLLVLLGTRRLLLDLRDLLLKLLESLAEGARHVKLGRIVGLDNRPDLVVASLTNRP